MKILIISDAWYPQINGVVRTYEHITAELHTLGHDTKVIGPADFPLTIPTPGYAEIRLAIMPHHRLKKMITEYTPDKIHISTEGPLGRAARKYCLKHNRPFSTSYHTQFPDYIAKRLTKFMPFLYKRVHKIAVGMMRKFHSASNVMFVATQSLEDTLIDWGFKNPMHRLTRGANLELFHPPTDDESDKAVFKDYKSPIALYVGRIAIEKSIEDFLAMEWDGSKIVIGEGPSRAELESQYPDAVFLGSKTGTDLADHYRAADVFVFPSRTDTFGMVMIEALACGLPIAGYNVTGPKDVITEDYLGCLDEDLSAAAKTALSRGTKQQRADHVKRHHTWHTVAQQYLDALNNKVV